MTGTEKISIGLLISDLGPSQKAFWVVRAANKLIEDGHHVVIFYQHLVPPSATPNCPMMQMVEAYHFRGAVLATCFSTALQASKMYTPDKLFWSHDVDWVRQPQHLELLRNTYMNEKIPLFCRSDYQRKLIFSTFNRRAVVLPEQDLCDVTSYIPKRAATSSLMST